MAAKGTNSQAGRLSLAFRDLDEIHPRIVEKFAAKVVDLDLSNNNLSNIDPLKAFTKLETLVLDNNKISSHTKFPPLPKLSTLWVNHNNITNLSVFIDKLVDSVPNLKYLSMLGNEACPNFLNGGSLKQYNDYRQYIINRLRNLTQLDAGPISEDERRKALKLYGSLPTSVAKEEEERERDRLEQEQREQERLQRERDEAARRKAERRKLRQKKKELLLKKQAEIERLKAEEEQKKLEEGRKKSDEPLPPIVSIADLLPDIEETHAPVEIPNTPPPPVFAQIQEDDLTSDDDWSDDDDDDDDDDGWE